MTEGRRFVVYRVFDKTGRLIYTGSSGALETRLDYHRTQSWWHALLDRVDVEEHPTRKAAFDAEAEAIRAERPVFNHHHIGPRKGHLTDDDIRVCREWCEKTDLAGALPLRIRWLIT